MPGVLIMVRTHLKGQGGLKMCIARRCGVYVVYGRGFYFKTERPLKEIPEFSLGISNEAQNVS